MKRIYSDSFDSEIYCKNVFHNFLKSNNPNIKLMWIRYPNGPNEPPDFNLAIGKMNYAVEVTETKVIRKERGSNIEERTFLNSRVSFVRELNKEANELNILNGHYIVFFLVSWTKPLTAKLKKRIRLEVINYIVDTKNEYTFEPHEIKDEYLTICQVFKIKNKRNCVSANFADGAWPNSLDNQRYILDIVQDAISEKKRKLSAKNIPPPRILILINTYSFAHPEHYVNCLSKLKNVNYFHSIFIVMSDMSFFLYTSEKDWKRGK